SVQNIEYPLGGRIEYTWYEANSAGGGGVTPYSTGVALHTEHRVSNISGTPLGVESKNRKYSDPSGPSFISAGSPSGMATSRRTSVPSASLKYNQLTVRDPTRA